MSNATAISEAEIRDLVRSVIREVLGPPLAIPLDPEGSRKRRRAKVRRSA